MKLIDRIKDRVVSRMRQPLVGLENIDVKFVLLIGVPKRYDFSVDGCRFVLMAQNDKEAWAKARRIAGKDNKELRRIAQLEEKK